MLKSGWIRADNVLVTSASGTWVSPSAWAATPPAHPAGSSPLGSDDLAFWEEQGYLVLPGFFTDDEVDAVNSEVEELWAHPSTVDPYITIAYPGSHRRLRDADGWARDTSYRIFDLFQISEPVKRLSLAPRLAAVLGHLLGSDPVAIQTLNFERGSQQPDHFDSWYMPGPVENAMLATWIALEDCRPAAGPLRYYPRSNNVAPYRFSHGQLWQVPEEMPACLAFVHEQITAHRMRAELFLPRKGDVLIWHAQLLHGGSVIDDKNLTRRSLVTHYFRLAELDMAFRATLPAEDLAAQTLAVAPEWYATYVKPSVARTFEGVAYLEKRNQPPAGDDFLAARALLLASARVASPPAHPASSSPLGGAIREL